MTKRFRLTAPEPAEMEVHVACAKVLDALLLPPAIWACYPAGQIKLSEAQMARYKRVGLKRGWPDLFIIYQALVFGIELKKRGGQLSKTRIARDRRGQMRIYEGQEDVFPRLFAAGMPIAIVHSVDEMLEQIQRWGIPLRAQVQPHRPAAAA
jgi:hypothetical protein